MTNLILIICLLLLSKLNLTYFINYISIYSKFYIEKVKTKYNFYFKIKML